MSRLFRLSHRAFARVFLGLAISAVCLAGEAAAPLKLKFLIPVVQSSQYDEMLSEIAREYNLKNRRAQIELQQHGKSFENLRALIAANYAGDLPDIAVVSAVDLEPLRQLKLLRPLPPDWVEKKRFLPNLMTPESCGQANGSVCSVPFERYVPLWYFNQELLFRFKQDTDKIPTRWPALSALSNRLGKSGEIWGLALPIAGRGCTTLWSALGLNLLGDQLSPAEAGVAWVEELWKSPGNWLPGHPDLQEATRQFLAQRAVILLGNTAQWNTLKESATFRFGSVLPESANQWSGSDIVVLSKGERGAAARDFLDFLFRSEIALRLFRHFTVLPVSQTYWDDPRWKPALAAYPAGKLQIVKRLRLSGVAKIATQTRDEWTSLLWQSVEATPPASGRAQKGAELKASLEKLLSTNPR